MEETKLKVVLYPFVGVGHLRPMVELAMLFRRHDVSVTIAVINTSSMSSAASSFISQVSSENTDISFHLLPAPSSPPNPSSKPFLNIFSMLSASNIELLSFLKSESETGKVSALVVDFFCVEVMEAAMELGIPPYIFFSCGAADLAVFLHLPTILSKAEGPLTGPGGKTRLSVPGVPDFRASDFRGGTLNPDSEEHKVFFPILKKMAEAKGILINTFESLEPRAVRALRDGLCVPNHSTPPIYCIGPLIMEDGKKEGESKHPCLQWLDEQPKHSVVYLCFGSRGSFPVEQLKEMAIGLENSNQRFLWVVRSPPSTDPAAMYEPLAEPDLDKILPEGFLDRTKDRGLVVKSWAPQVEVLKHVAVGGFVSHCGWNSILEAVINGVPIICWPLYAEQLLNKVFLVEEMKIGVELNGYEEGLVMAGELEEKIRWLTESEGGKEMKNRILADKESAIEALRAGGLSDRDFREFLGGLNI
ncbi:hypothetical protein LUZ60_000537 [Juncus effusus]|nr:hypothetical protein LUZ60_000537 [Juncus effusus]